MKVLKFHTTLLKIRNCATENDFWCTTISRSLICCENFVNLSRLIGNLCDLVTLPWTFTALNFVSVITFDLANASIQDHTKASPRQHTSTCIWCNSKQSDGLDGTKKPVPFLNSLRERLWCYKIDHRTMKIV